MHRLLFYSCKTPIWGYKYKQKTENGVKFLENKYFIFLEEIMQITNVYQQKTRGINNPEKYHWPQISHKKR